MTSEAKCISTAFTYHGHYCNSSYLIVCAMEWFSVLVQQYHSILELKICISYLHLKIAP